MYEQNMIITIIGGTTIINFLIASITNFMRYYVIHIKILLYKPLLFVTILRQYFEQKCIVLLLFVELTIFTIVTLNHLYINLI